MNRIRTRSKGFMLFSIYSVPFVKPNTIYCVLLWMVISYKVPKGNYNDFEDS